MYLLFCIIQFYYQQSIECKSHNVHCSASHSITSHKYHVSNISTADHWEVAETEDRSCTEHHATVAVEFQRPTEDSSICNTHCTSSFDDHQ